MSLDNQVRRHLERGGPAVVVLGPSADAHTADVLRRFGGGWSTAIDTWRHLPRGFVLLVVDGLERVRKRAPFVVLVRREADLIGAVDIACEMLAGKTAVWLTVGLETMEQAVHDHLAIDCEVAGCA